MTTWFVVAGYLFLVTMAGQFHQHGNHANHLANCSCDSDCHEAAEAHCHNEASHESEGSGQSVDADFHASDEDCSICQFLAQKLICVKATENSSWEDLRERAAVAEPVRVVLWIASAHRSRAPPSVV